MLWRKRINNRKRIANGSFRIGALENDFGKFDLVVGHFLIPPENSV